MARVNVKIQGMEGIIQRLHQLSDAAATDALEAAVRVTAEACRDIEISKSPSKTGRLKSSYQIQTVFRDRNRVRLGLYMDKAAWYYRFLELGTKYISDKDWIRKVFKPKRGWLRNLARDTFRDRIQGFLD